MFGIHLTFGDVSPFYIMIQIGGKEHVSDPYLSGEMIFPQKIIAISRAMKLKKLAAFQRNETVKENGRYQIPGVANSKQVGTNRLEKMREN